MTSKNAGPLLVIEDGDEDFEMLQLAFERCGVSNVLVRQTDGDEALAYLHAAPQRPAMVLLDLNLAGTDGRDVLHELKRHPTLRSIPLMVLSTSNNPRDVERCYREGANCYAVKPVGLEKLERLVEHFKVFWLESMELPAAGASES